MRASLFIFVFIPVIGFFACNETAPETANSKTDTAQQVKPDPVPADHSFASKLSYSIISESGVIALKNDSLKMQINLYLQKHPAATIDSLTDFILDLTANQLRFSFGKCSSNPNQLKYNSEANCIGYAALFNSVMNYALTKKAFSGKYKCRHYRGKVWHNGQEMTAIFNDPFFKDHDFNIIENSFTGEKTGIDPSLYDYLGIKRVLIKEESK